MGLVIEHQGVKGMRWGQRKSRVSSDKSAKKVAKADKKWEKKAVTNKTYLKTYNEMADKMNATEISRINNDPRFKGKDLNKSKKLLKEYDDEYSQTATRILNESAAKNIGTNASGTKEVRFDYNINDNFGWPVMRIVDKEKVKHDGFNTVINTERNDKGFIIELSLPSVVVQSDMIDDTVDEILQHFGVKGMRWGQRKSQTKSSTPPKLAPADKPEIKNLSNQDLAAKVQRMQLERQYNQLASPSASKTKSKGREFVQSMALNILRTQVQNTANALIGREIEKRFNIKASKKD